MRWSSVVCMVFSIALPAAENSVISRCETSLPTWTYDQYQCNNKPIHYSHDAASLPLLGGDTTINYDLKKINTIETVSMGAKYSNDLFSAQLQSSYVKDRFDNIPSLGKTNLSLQYHRKLWDSLILNASENVSIPVKTDTDSMKYTSLLKALYPVNSTYNIFAEGSYSLLQLPSSENSAYRNPYSYTTGISYADGTDTAINASYSLVQNADLTQGSNKKIKIAHKHQINKKMKTIVSITKSLETKQQEDKASFDLLYAF